MKWLQLCSSKFVVRIEFKMESSASIFFYFFYFQIILYTGETMISEIRFKSHRSRWLSMAICSLSLSKRPFVLADHPLKREEISLSGLKCIVMDENYWEGQKDKERWVRQTASDVWRRWWQEKPWPSSRILITAGSSTSRRLISSTVGFIGITDADKVIAQGEIKHYKIKHGNGYE